MNAKIIFQCLLCAILFVGCKNDKDKKETKKEEVTSPSENSKSEVSNIFSVKLNLKSQKDDALEVFYLENETDTYMATQMIQKKIMGTDGYQEVQFDLPKDIYPYNIRMDFGSNKEQNPIQISECTLSYNQKSFVIKGKELKSYFNFNGGIEMQSDSLTFKLKPFNLNGKEVYDPYIVGNKNLETALMTKI